MMFQSFFQKYFVQFDSLKIPFLILDDFFYKMPFHLNWAGTWLYSKVSNKRTVFNNRTGGDIILQKV